MIGRGCGLNGEVCSLSCFGVNFVLRMNLFLFILFGFKFNINIYLEIWFCGKKGFKWELMGGNEEGDG